MVRAPRVAFLLTFGFYALLWPALVVLLTLWDDTLYWERVPPQVTTAPTTAPVWWPREMRQRSLAEVWNHWHRRGPIGDAEILFGVLLAAGVVVYAVLAWLHLPTIHAGGRVTASYARALRGLAGIFPPLLVGTAIIGSWIVFENHREMSMSAHGVWGFSIVRFALPMTCLAAGLMMVAWVGRAMAGAATCNPTVTLPPLCEGCGYNLTHVPQAGRCPECGLDAALSLVPALKREGWTWERSAGWIRLHAWFETTRQCLLRPQAFYERLEVRSDPRPAMRFARWHLAMLGVASAFWVPVMILFDRDFLRIVRVQWSGPSFTATTLWLLACAFVLCVGLRALLAWLAISATILTIFLIFGLEPGYEWQRDELHFLPFAALLVFPLIGWAAHRLIGAVAASYWFIRGELADPRAARKVVAYESVFLWAFWFYGLALSTSFMIFQNWIEDLFGRRWIAGLPLAVVVSLAGVAALGVVWVYRFYLAGRAVRWANC